MSNPKILIQLPVQDEALGREVLVFPILDSNVFVRGIMVRSDDGIPFVNIIKLDDSRYVLGHEYRWMRTDSIAGQNFLKSQNLG